MQTELINVEDLLTFFKHTMINCDSVRYTTYNLCSNREITFRSVTAEQVYKRLQNLNVKNATV